MQRRGGSERPVKGRRAIKPKARAIAAPSIADLQNQVGILTRELQEAREQQSATSDVLQVISRSAFDLRAVLQTLVESAARLCEADMANIWRPDGTAFRLAASFGIPGKAKEKVENVKYLESVEIKPGRGSMVGRVLLEKRSVQIPDIQADPEYKLSGIIRIGNYRTALGVPLLREGIPIGVIFLSRCRVEPFTDKHIELITTFADQAVIAIENGRLFDEVQARTHELAESLQQQTATADVLKVISRSAFDLKTVLDALLASACRLCEADLGTIRYREGSDYRLAATFGFEPEWKDHFSRYSTKPDRGSIFGRTIVDGCTVHIPDVLADPDFQRQSAQNLLGFRAALGVPLVRDGQTFGVISLLRFEVGSFNEKQIELVKTFADQAVIAIENVRLITETREALERQTATAEVLQVINSSPGDLAPVFDAILEKAHSLCGVSHGSLQLYDGEKFRAVAVHGISEAFANRLRQGFVPGPNHPSQPLLIGARFAQVPDCAGADDPIVRAAFELGGIRTVLFIPLRKDGSLLGQIAAARRDISPFTEKEIALLENFAAQAVIAMENARLLTEQREALERQTATAEVLQAINSSPGDLAPVFEMILEKAHSLCAVALGTLLLYDGGKFRAVAVRGFPETFAAHLRQGFVPGPNLPHSRLLDGARFAQVMDWAEIDDPLARASLEAGVRTSLFIPLRREGALLGYIAASRAEVRPFTEKEVALLESFAAQAVIAMENARLLGELHERTADLARSVDELTATSDVLKIISRSTVDLETVLDTLVETAARLCRADQARMYRRQGDHYHSVASHGFLPESEEWISRNPLPNAGRGTAIARAAAGRCTVHIADVLADPEYTWQDGQRVAGFRTVLAVPLLRGETLTGLFSLLRTRVAPFTEKEIELISTFADQAAIAIENARLFEELRDRQAELARSVDELTATGDVLKIISRSTVDLTTVLDTLVETVARLCRADQAVMFRLRDDIYEPVATRGLSEQAKAYFTSHPPTPGRGTTAGRVELELRPVHIPDVLQDAEYTYTEVQKVAGFRTVLGVPLLRKKTLVGIFSLNRIRVDPFTDKEIELVSTFADQAAIAIENARLFEELRDRQAELRVTFDNMGDGVVMFDSGLRLTAWNRNFQEILDLPESFLAQRPSYIEYFHYLAERGEYSADLEAELGRRLHETDREQRIERTRPDGRVIEVRRNPVPGGGFVLIFADVTERKRAEEAISAARDAAEKALRELQTAQASLVHAQKMAALGQVTAGIAHEIKNPLNFVNNFAGLSVELLDELKQASAQAVGELDGGKRAEILDIIRMLTGNLQKIAEHGRRADGIVRAMLQHSRGSSGDWQVTDLNALVEESLSLAYHGARAQDQNFDVALERDFDSDLAPLDVVPQEITRVLLNLIGNGFYAANQRSREGNGAFRPALTVTTRDFGEGVELRVRDNGIGIPPEDYEKLFQPFFTTKPTGEGTGLGLSISYEIITQQHGGTIAVDSRVGDFTEFTVRLPRRRVRS